MNDQTYWAVAFPIVLEALRGVVFEHWGDEVSGEDFSIGQSVTEWEVRSALLQNPADVSRVHWFRSQFKEKINNSHPKYWDYDDTLDDASKRSGLQQLLRWMESHFPTDRVSNYNDATFEDFTSSDVVWTAQFNKWQTDMRALLQNSLHALMDKCEQWKLDGCGLGLQGSVLSEMLHHSQWARVKTIDYFGREELVTKVVGAVFGSHTPGADPLSGLALCVIGGSGCGKTALMAKVASEVFLEQQKPSVPEHIKQRPIIIRFCGTSAGSNSGLELVRSVCLQIIFSYRCHADHPDVRSLGFEGSVELLHSLVAKYAVVLIIDSLDQLTNDNLARSDLSFLKSLRPHEFSRVIVSALPDEFDHGECFLCLVLFTAHYYIFCCCRVE